MKLKGIGTRNIIFISHRLSKIKSERVGGGWKDLVGMVAYLQRLRNEEKPGERLADGREG